MLNAGYVIGSYAATFAAIAGYTLYLLRRARRLSDRVTDEDRPWT